jgi:hypothetical protein
VKERKSKNKRRKERRKEGNCEEKEERKKERKKEIKEAADLYTQGNALSHGGLSANADDCAAIQVILRKPYILTVTH